IFGWLLFRDRLNTKVNLHHKTIADNSCCLRCDHHLEDAAHLALTCPRAVQVWRLLDFHSPSNIDLLWDIVTPDGLDINIWPTVALAILWKLWDSHNAQVFCSETHSAQDTMRNVISDLTLWVLRFKDHVSREAAMSWRLYLSSHYNL
uniref:Reverse transcriptase zinc-binding domain-containing protein n=1 Tax=Triticum urartu TaxID=4572 RepID=A0A8R7UK78_TRIUA